MKTKLSLILLVLISACQSKTDQLTKKDWHLYRVSHNKVESYEEHYSVNDSPHKLKFNDDNTMFQTWSDGRRMAYLWQWNEGQNRVTLVNKYGEKRWRISFNNDYLIVEDMVNWFSDNIVLYWYKGIDDDWPSQAVVDDANKTK